MKNGISLFMAVVIVLSLACPALAAVPGVQEALLVEWSMRSSAGAPGAARQGCAVTNVSDGVLTDIAFTATCEATGIRRRLDGASSLEPGETRTLQGSVVLDEPGAWSFEVTARTVDGADTSPRAARLWMGSGRPGDPYVLDNGGFPMTCGTLLADLEDWEGVQAELLQDSEPASSAACVATGQTLNVLSQIGIPLCSQQVAVMGDVTGTGKAGLTQLARLTAAYVGREPLVGIWLVAGDLNESGSIDLGDLILAAGQYLALVEAQDADLSSRTLPLYQFEAAQKDEIELHYVEGRTDIPYLSVEDALEVLKRAYELKGDPNATMTSEDHGGVYTWRRENGSQAELNFFDGRVTFEDFNGLSEATYASTCLDIVAATGEAMEGSSSSESISRPPGSYEKAGHPVAIDLRSYGIPLVYTDGMGYLPLATFSDLFLVPSRMQMICNGQMAAILPNGILGDLEEPYYAAPTGPRSTELASFTYHELCLALDMYYGLKEQHDITTFDAYFRQTGLADELMGVDPVVADTALLDLCMAYLSDLHTNLIAYSYCAGADAPVDFTIAGSSWVDWMAAYERFGAARAEVFPDGVAPYQEVGNTAFVTLDMVGLAMDEMERDMTPPEPGATNTVAILRYAHSQIMREDSPIENVVLDLSNNIGGNGDAAVFAISWFLGDVVFNLEDTLTGAQASTRYRADINGDGKFDDADTLSSKNLYCLTSPVTFSTGNLIAASFKASGVVTMLGRKTGGGACVLCPLALADGTIMVLSGPNRLCTLSNGSFYEVDRGVEPDVSIRRIQNFYDREALSQRINGLFR